eukprot:TRINITY_DN4063_c0_g1_i1.p1 TRINITY_DN4063_c0_g1~~TRINITY_DN4063_c0_g1_i1.p1  ORF type:complete len:188 (-),score=12.33 TRINITY_DN4063_c0_g1_i1:668-1231(-)
MHDVVGDRAVGLCGVSRLELVSIDRTRIRASSSRGRAPAALLLLEPRFLCCLASSQKKWKLMRSHERVSKFGLIRYSSNRTRLKHIFTLRSQHIASAPNTLLTSSPGLWPFPLVKSGNHSQHERHIRAVFHASGDLILERLNGNNHPPPARTFSKLRLPRSRNDKIRTTTLKKEKQQAFLNRKPEHF